MNGILLYGTGDTLSLSAIRLLGRYSKSYRLYGISPASEKYKSPEYSRYLSGTYTFKSDLTEEVPLAEEILEISGQTNAGLILPMGEEFVHSLIRLAPALTGHMKLPDLPEEEDLLDLIYKNRLASLLEKIQLPTPRTYDAGRSEAIPDEAFPCLIKPVHLGGGYGIESIADKGVLEEYLMRAHEIPFVDPADGFILQEVIPGFNIDCSLLAKNGQLLAITVQQAISEPGYTYPTAVEFLQSSAIESYAEQLVRHTNYSGLAHLDFRFDERDNKPKLIDFNARVWRSMTGSAEAGVNFMKLWLDATLGNEIQASEYDYITYYMKKQAVKGTYKKYFGSDSRKGSVRTDIRYRVSDPFPELMSVWFRLYTRIIDHN